ncbi:MAG: DUF1700 domain-containing protein [Bacilli bacterium]|nr:DUF1700 domain-containing protein [Bacilli bacterium]MBN2877072.1 DUF1700 domain-containing protein [Bacilli bacterium]
MRRKDFLRELKEELRKRRDIEGEEVLFYYDELIQDAVEGGESEEIFVANLGNVRDIVRRLEDDEEFVAAVRQKNNDIVHDVLSISVKIIGYFIFGVIAFVLIITSFSLLASGIGVFFGAILKILFTGPFDLYGYLAMGGLMMIGVGIIVFSIALFKWFIDQAKPALLSIFRNTKEFISRKGK